MKDKIKTVIKESLHAYMQAIGRRGGQSRSRKKVLAARRNAQKAGRPKGSKNKIKIVLDFPRRLD